MLDYAYDLLYIPRVGAGQPAGPRKQDSVYACVFQYSKYLHVRLQLAVEEARTVLSNCRLFEFCCLIGSQG